jgi:hypothetical protein
VIDRPPGPPLDGNTELRTGVGRVDASGDADSDFCARLLAMASHDLRQPLQVIVGAHDVLARILHGSAAQAQLARVEEATRQLNEAHLPVASAAGDEHATAARRIADGALSAGPTSPRPVVGLSPRSPQRLPSGREVAAAWLLCVFITVLAFGAINGLHNSEPPGATVANKTAIPWHMRAVCTPPLPCTEGGTASFEPW